MARRARLDHRLSKRQIAVGVIVAVTAVFAYDFGSLLLRTRELDLQASAHELEIKELREEGLILEQKLQYVRSDEYVFSAAPDVLLWGDPNATYVMPVEPTPAAKAP